MKNVLFFIPTLCGGGAERVLVTAVNNLDRNKYHIVVQTLADGGVYKRELDGQIEYRSIVRTKNAFIRKAFLYLIQYVIPAKWIYLAFVKNNYDIEIAYLGGYPVKLISSSTNKKSGKYAWIHSDISMFPSLTRIFGSKEKHCRCYEKFDKIVCVSEGVKERFINYFHDMAVLSVQRNPVDEVKIRMESTEPVDDYVFDEKCVNLISVGSLEYVKGFDRLLDALKKLFDDEVNFRMCILGSGSAEPSLKAKALELGISDKVCFLGYRTNPYKYVAKSDIYVCSSRVEGLSTAVTEALILGIPVVTTDCPGMSELLDNGELGVICGNDGESIYGALKQIVCDKNLADRYIGQINKKYSGNLLEAVMKEYNELLGD